MLLVACPKCQRSFSLADEKEGLKVKCPCGRVFTAVGKGHKAKSSSSAAPIVIGVAVLAMVVISLLVFAGGSKKKPKAEEPERVAKTTPRPRVTRPSIADAVGGEVIPLCKRYVEAVLADDRASLEEMIDFVAYWNSENTRLATKGVTLGGADQPLEGERYDRYVADLLMRITEPNERFRTWQLIGYRLQASEPKLEYVGNEDGSPDYDSVEVRIKIENPSKLKGGVMPAFSFHVYVTRPPATKDWKVYDCGIFFKYAGKMGVHFVPHPEDPDNARSMRAGGGQLVDVDKDVEAQLSEVATHVKLADGSSGLASKPRPMPYFESTPPAVRDELDKQIRLMLDPDLAIERHRAMVAILKHKRDAVPPLLTALYESYKRAVQEAQAGDPMRDAEQGKVHFLVNALTRMRLEVYLDNDETASNQYYSLRETSDPARVRQLIQKATIFWFGWWDGGAKEVTPAGEPHIPGKKKRRGRGE